MSAQTLQAVEAAIAAHVADEAPGQLLSDFIVVTQSQHLDNHLSKYGFIQPEAQVFHSTDGLLRTGLRILSDVWDSSDEVID